ncbi:MAG: FtsX-like permease family protein [Candidatus Lokiarchaeota archaeon]|nr:FtsX-like permease family protein [Candidatus Lokiarchaeota archaeon]
MLMINKSIEIKIAYRNLLKHPIRSFFTILSIILGIGLFFSVNIAIDSLEYSLYTNFDQSELGDVETWIYLFRGVLMALSGISLILCVIIIKNLMEMSRENQVYEIGLLRTLGMTKTSIFLTIFFQVIIFAIIGLLIGLIFGYFLSNLFFGPLKSILGTFLSIETEFNVELFISPLTYSLTVLSGLIIPLLFGMIPAYKASKTEILNALRPYLSARVDKIKAWGFSFLKLIISLFFIIGSIIIISLSYSGLLSFSDSPTLESSVSILFLFISGTIFITGSIILGGTILPYLSRAISYLLSPILLKIRKICQRNIERNLRRSRNSFFIISMALALLIMIQIIFSSIDAGIVPGARMRLGGDLRLGIQWSSDQTRIPMNTSLYLNQLEGVETVCEVKNTIGKNSKIEDFGLDTNEEFILYVINTSSYVDIHEQNSIYKYEVSTSFSDFIRQLDQVGTILLQEELSVEINKPIGEEVNIVTNSWAFPSLNENLTLIGFFDVLPGIYHSFLEGNAEEHEYCGIISWETYFNITGFGFNQTTSNFWIGCENPLDANNLRDQIQDLYLSLGDPWNTVDLDNDWIYRTINDEISLIKEIVNLILIIIVSILYMAMIISIFGTITSMLMNISQRQNEIGIFRAIGTSKLQILKIISGEIFIIGVTSILVGLICGILGGYLLSNVPFIAYVPFIFKINWNDIIIVSLVMLSLTILGSIIPAIKANRLNIITNIRNRGI